MVNRHGRMLQRNLFYTAITRARKKVWVIGEADSVLRAVGNDKVVRRNTVLRHLVKKD
jgi:exodeoxyribonuclease V alpha subunit